MLAAPACTTVDDSARQPGFRARIIFLGASNLTRSIATAVNTTRRLLGPTLDIHAVMGHGRSYGMDSFFLIRRLPGIVHSPMWRHLETQRPLPTYALLTDIGNDIMYAVPPMQIIGYIQRCIERLAAHHSRLIITAPPVARLTRLSRGGYWLARTLFFPRNRMPMTQAMHNVATLDRRLREFAADRSIPIIDAPLRWYGLDPIHMRKSHWQESWAHMLSPWAEHRPPDHVHHDHTPAWRPCPGQLAAARWWLFGRIRCARRQPCARLSDGSTLSLW